MFTGRVYILSTGARSDGKRREMNPAIAYIPSCPTCLPLETVLVDEIEMEAADRDPTHRWYRQQTPGTRRRMILRTRSRLAAYHVEMYGGAF